MQQGNGSRGCCTAEHTMLGMVLYVLQVTLIKRRDMVTNTSATSYSASEKINKQQKACQGTLVEKVTLAFQISEPPP
jgi:hypothetical protein